MVQTKPDRGRGELDTTDKHRGAKAWFILATEAESESEESSELV